MVLHLFQYFSVFTGQESNLMILSQLTKSQKKKYNCVCGTINPRGLFMFSLFWLSSTAFSDFIADIVQKFELCTSASRTFFPCTESKGAIPSGQDGLILPARVANQISLHIANERFQLFNKHYHRSSFKSAGRIYSLILLGNAKCLYKTSLLSYLNFIVILYLF